MDENNENKIKKVNTFEAKFKVKRTKDAANVEMTKNPL